MPRHNATNQEVESMNLFLSTAKDVSFTCTKSSHSPGPFPSRRSTRHSPACRNSEFVRTLGDLCWSLYQPDHGNNESKNKATSTGTEDPDEDYSEAGDSPTPTQPPATKETRGQMECSTSEI